MATLISPDGLRRCMDARGIGMGRLAKAAGCSKGFISHLVAGRRSRCSAQLARDIAEALSVEPGALFADLDAIVISRKRNPKLRDSEGSA